MELFKKNYLLDGGSILLETDNGYYLFNKNFSDSESLKNNWFLSDKNSKKLELVEDNILISSLNELRDNVQVIPPSKLINNLVGNQSLEPLQNTNPRNIGCSEHVALEILKTTCENPKKLKVTWNL